MTKPPGLPTRFYSLDCLRGIAAITVVFWHWPHFFFDVPPDVLIAYDRMPLYDVLFPLYHMGYLGVSFFFTLSGFIFFWLYSEAVETRKIGAGEFALLRFSRLYPLHFLTLCLVAIGQAVSMNVRGEYFAFTINDAYHFFLQVLFISEWGLQKGFSFNGPIWSVSVEVLLYVLFFVICRLRLIQSRYLILYLFIAWTIGFQLSNVGHGMFQFFLGGLVFRAFEALRTRPKLWRIYVNGLTVVNGLLLAFLIYDSRIEHSLLESSAHVLYTGILFPGLILSSVLWEMGGERVWLRKLAVLGDISYASYLLHFPLQLFIALYFYRSGLNLAFFYSPVALIGFLLLLLGLSKLSYDVFEMPLQRLLRRKFLPQKPGRREVDKAKG